MLSNKEKLEKVYLGKKIHVIIAAGLPYDVDAWGIVEKVDDLGNLYGTWGSTPINPAFDYVSLYE